ncbi:MAG TPA: DivIVA domain-containing protein [Actinomycetes bacterium]|nr:DivIVA domain-containing protein [Actinomycetes bacterium]
MVRRGYDREQVDAYVAEAGDRVDQAERAKAQLELEVAAVRERRPASYEQLGAEAAMVLEQAGREAATVLERAGRSAEMLVEQAQGRARTTVSEAQARAADLIRAAEQQAEQFHATARQHLEEVQAETEQVGEFRRGLLHYLGRVRADIDSLIDKAAEQDDQRTLAVAAAGGPRVDAAADPTGEGASTPAGTAGSEQLQPVAPSTEPSDGANPG